MKRISRAKKRDANENEIVYALQVAGCTVVRLDKPVDLLVGHRGVNVLVEVKNKDGGNKLTDDQKRFFSEWQGQSCVVRTAEEAIREVQKATERIVKMSRVQDTDDGRAALPARD